MSFYSTIIAALSAAFRMGRDETVAGLPLTDEQIDELAEHMAEDMVHETWPSADKELRDYLRAMLRVHLGLPDPNDDNRRWLVTCGDPNDADGRRRPVEAESPQQAAILAAEDLGVTPGDCLTVYGHTLDLKETVQAVFELRLDKAGYRSFAEVTPD